jgi:hypothetical protein
MTTIPASAIVRVTPSVLEAGGRALDIIGLLLTNSTRVPIGAIQPFSNANDVSDYFGPTSAEASLGAIYFQGFTNSNTKPSRILFTQYPTASVAAYLRGGEIDTLTITELQNIPVGNIGLTVNGSLYTAGAVNLSTATSFSSAASIINTAFGGTAAIPFVTTFDSIAGAFLFTTNSTGTGATITYAGTSTLGNTLLLTQMTGAVISQGAVAATPAAFMNAVINVTQDWATFLTTFDPDISGNDNKLLFAQWNATQNNRWAYIAWDTDSAPKFTVPAPTSLGQKLIAGNYSGTILISCPDASKAAYVSGAAASIDFSEHNGRITFAFKSQSGLTADITDQTTADNLEANGYNYYGVWATANDQFIFLYPGSVSGEFKWADSYINEIWLNNQFQLAMMVLLTNTKSIPYNQQGYSLIEAAGMDVINQGLNFGAFRAGVTLSEAQAAEVNADAGITISTILNQRGWYFQVLDASPQVRQARGSPPITFWYMDGESVQRINIASIDLL